MQGMLSAVGPRAITIRQNVAEVAVLVNVVASSRCISRRAPACAVTLKGIRAAGTLHRSFSSPWEELADRGRGSGGGSSSGKPVPQEFLAGIPWAGRSTLAGLMQRVAADGPHDTTVWRKLVARADVIAHSLTAKQASLILSALAKARHRDESFLRRFSVRFVPALVPTAELIDLCGMLSGLSQLGAYREETFALFAKRAAESSSRMDARQLSLVANAFVRVGHRDRELFERLLAQVPRKLKQFDARDVAVLLNALAQLPAASEASATSADASEPDSESAGPLAASEEHLQAIALRLPQVLPEADLHSLALILNAFAQLQFAPKDAIDLIVEELLASPRRLERMSARQLAMVLNAAAKLHLYDPRLLDALAARVRATARQLDAQALCLVANASARLRLGIDTFAALYAQVPRRLAQLNGRQLAMIVHAWAKGHVHNDDLFALVALPLATKAPGLSAREIALALYGYAHFRKRPAELFEPLLTRFSQLLASREVGDGDLLMVANALGRIGWYDEAVAEALGGYQRRDPALTNLSPQALATFPQVAAAAESSEDTHTMHAEAASNK
eukprot:TRINITY_DN2710_c0_g1_i3.p1 TRINITY_DN2710_c0_g1~~TRINITY_DN2710_c0_g1_i3.p1  ORF type:complete len:564 (+),score=135.52 TRINITY_DN2710_c0_g1_i3:86-1777(+)